MNNTATKEIAQHSPAPWIVEHPHGEPGVYVGAANTSLVAKVYDADLGSAQTEANALLIAAAPELLEALKAVVSVADRKTDEFDLAHAAIAKAQGQQTAEMSERQK